MGSDTLTLGFVGDINLGGAIRRSMTAEGTAYPFARVSSALTGHDLLVGNLECCALSNEALPSAPRPAMTASAAQLSALTEAGFAVAGLANNHVMDAGTLGLDTMLARLTELGIATVGAGINAEHAVRPIRMNLGNRRLGMIAACDHSAHWARRRRPGVAALDWRRLLEQAAKLAADTDLVVVLLHADVEFAPVPSPRRVLGARRLVEAGAHLVIQHHPHVRQGVERYRHGLIAYSLGNFVFPIEGNTYQQRHPETRESFILTVEAQFGRESRPELVWRAIPVTIGKDHRPCLVTGPTRQERLLEINALCALLADNRQLRRDWHRRCIAELRRTLYAVYYSGRRGNHRAAIRGALDAIRRPDERRYLWGAITGGRF